MSGGLLLGGDLRDDQRIDGDICIANVYREARSATRKLQPMYPQDFWTDFIMGCKRMPTIFQMFSNSHICFAPRLLGLLQGVDRPLGKCGACAHERQLTREEFTTLSIPVEVEGHPLKSVQDALDHFFRWEDVDFGIECPD